MDIKSILIENTLLKLERNSKRSLSEDTIKEVVDTLRPLLQQPESGPEVTYKMSLEDAVKYELTRVKVKGVMHDVTLEEKDKEDVQLNKAAEGIANSIDSKITREQLMEAKLLEGVKQPEAKKLVPNSTVDLKFLSERLCGEDLDFNDEDKKTIRITYKKLTETKSQDEPEDFKTIVEVLKDDPDGLDEYANFKKLVETVLSEFSNN